MNRTGDVPDAPITDVVAGWSSETTQWVRDIGSVRIAVVVTILVAGVVAAVRYGRSTGDAHDPSSRTPTGTGPSTPTGTGSVARH